MSIADIQNAMKRIQENRRSYAAEVERIRQDNTLSEIGRAQKISRAYDNALERHQALVSKFNQAKADTRRVLAQDAFSPNVSSTMNRAEAQAIRDSYTAAQVRADAIKDAQGLRRMIELASVSGDKNSALAAAFVAYERAQIDVLDRFDVLKRFSELFPVDGQYVENLYDFDCQYGAKMDADAKFTEKMQITGPSKPAEYTNFKLPESEEAS